MNLSKQHDTKSILINQRHFCTSTMRYQKQKLGGENPFYYSNNKKIKCLGINLTKEAKDLYSEKYGKLKKEIKEDTNKWKSVPCSLEELTL